MRFRYRMLYTSRRNGLSTVPNCIGGDDQFVRVDLFIPASAFMQMAATLRKTPSGWELNQLWQEDTFGADAEVPMAGRIRGRTVLTESSAEARNAVRKNNLLSTDRTAHVLSLF